MSSDVRNEPNNSKVAFWKTKICCKVIQHRLIPNFECMAKVNNVLWQCNQSTQWKKAQTSLYEKNYPWGSVFGLWAKPIKDLFFASSSAAMQGLKKYDMSISQTPKRVNLSYGRNNFLQVRNGDLIQVF